MSRVVVDDTSSSIRYTGWWEPSWGSPANSAWDYGSQAIFSFKGTSVFVYGDVAEGKGEVVRVDFSIDGGSVSSKYQTSRQNKVANVLWYESGNLPDGEHTLTMTYLPEDDMDFRLDRIEYTPSPPASHSSPPPDPPQIISTSTSIAVVVQTSTSSTLEVVSGTTVARSLTTTAGGRSTDSSSTSSGTSSQQLPSNDPLGAGENQTVTQTQYLPTAGATDVADSRDSSSRTAPDSTSGSSTRNIPVGAIVGGVLGTLLFLCLLILGFIVIRRRRRRSAVYALAEEKGTSSNKSQTCISPFNDPPTIREMPMAHAPQAKSALIYHNIPLQSPSGLTSDTGYAASETGVTVLTEAAPSYMSGIGARFREDFASDSGGAGGTWASGATEGSLKRLSQPPAYH